MTKEITKEEITKEITKADAAEKEKDSDVAVKPEVVSKDEAKEKENERVVTMVIDIDREDTAMASRRSESSRSKSRAFCTISSPRSVPSIWEGWDGPGYCGGYDDRNDTVAVASSRGGKNPDVLVAAIA
jgi:hypothetical protein